MAANWGHLSAMDSNAMFLESVFGMSQSFDFVNRDSIECKIFSGEMSAILMSFSNFV